MSEELKLVLQNWKSSTDNRKKLQTAYLLLAVLAIMTAGIIALIDAELGRSISFIALGATVIFFSNAVMWYLVVENAQDKITKPVKNTKKK